LASMETGKEGESEGEMEGRVTKSS